MQNLNVKPELPLLILDMDECLLHASSSKLDNILIDYEYQHLSVYFRPGVVQFLEQLSTKYQLAIWSTGTDAYVHALIAAVTPKKVNYSFVWGRSKCRKVKDDIFGYSHFYKPLDKLKRYGFIPEQITMIDDTPSKIVSNYATVIEIDAFEGAPDDNALILLLARL